jgi:hypothetical protein
MIPMNWSSALLKVPRDNPRTTLDRPGEPAPEWRTPAPLSLKHPLIQRIHAYWESKLTGRKMPRREDIVPEELGDLLPWVMLVDVIGDPVRFRLRLTGTGVVREYGKEVTGRYMDEIDLGSQRDTVLDDYRRAVRERRPVASSYDYQKSDRRWITYERILLPLANDGETINMLLCGMVMRGAGVPLPAEPASVAKPTFTGAKWPN